MTASQAPVCSVAAFDSAYPGSMSARKDGGYVRRDDPTSLAAAPLEGIAKRNLEIGDLSDAFDALRASHTALLANLRELVALHQRHVESLLEIAQELRQPRLPLATVATITVRRLAEIGQESLDAIAASTGAAS